MCCQTNKQLVEVTNWYHHLLHHIHCITTSALLYVVLLVCNLFLSKSGYYYTLNILKITISKWSLLDLLDNGSYSTLQLTTFNTYNMKIIFGPALLEFFNFLSQKSILIIRQNSLQTCNKIIYPPYDQL